MFSAALWRKHAGRVVHEESCFRTGFFTFFADNLRKTNVKTTCFIGGWGGESFCETANREIVSFRSCVRAGEAKLRGRAREMIPPLLERNQDKCCSSVCVGVCVGGGGPLVARWCPVWCPVWCPAGVPFGILVVSRRVPRRVSWWCPDGVRRLPAGVPCGVLVVSRLVS